MKITNTLIKDLDPCKNRFNNYLKFYLEKEHSKAQFLGLKSITHADKLWVAFRLMSKENVKLAAADIAELVLHIFENKYPNDNRPRKAIEAARNSSPNAAAYATYYATYYAYYTYYTNADAAAYAAAYATYYANADAADAAYATAYATAACAADINKKIRTIILKYWK